MPTAEPASESGKWSHWAGMGALVLGGTGFACGFFGPIALNPDANQGPLLGIFITGPGGALLGAALGALASALGLPPRRAKADLIGVAVVGALVILYFCIPGPRYRYELVEIEVTGCEPPSARKEEALARWEKAIARVDWAEPRAGWKEDFDKFATQPASVLTTTVLRRRELFERQAPWNKGLLIARPWTTTPDRRATRPGEFFARPDCSAFPPGTRAVFGARGEYADGWPPKTLSNFLDLRLLEPVPDPYLPFQS